MTKKIFTLLVLFSSVLQAQVRFTLQECIERGRISGPSAKILRSSFNSKRFTYKSFNAGLLPQLSLNGTIPDYSRAIIPVTQPDGSTIFVSQSQANSNVNLLLSQPLILTGGSVFVSSGLSWNRLIDLNVNTWRSSPLVVGFRQPLFQLNTLWWDNRQNEIRNAESFKKFNEDMEDAAIELTQKFFDAYVAQMKVENAALNVTINDSLLTLSRGRFEVGKIDENDLLQSELALANAQTDRSNAELDYKIAMRSLAIALGMSSENKFDLVAPTDTLDISPSVERALREAHSNRSDWDGFDLQHVNAERNLRQAELSNGFNATITASYGLNQTASEVKDAYKNLLDQQVARLDFSMPLWQWGKGSYAVDAAKADIDRVETSLEVQKKTFEDDVESSVQRYLRNREQLKLSMKADTIAQKQFNLASKRYLIGKFDVTKLLLAQDAKDKARQNLILQQKEYWLSYYRLRRFTLFDFALGKKIDYLVGVE